MTKTQQQILDILRTFGPMSSWDVEHAAKAKRFDPTPSSVRSRIAELRRAGLVEDTGERQPTGRGGRTARVWKAV